MPGGGVHAVQTVFLLLLLFVAAFAALARKLKTPYPIVLVLAGLLLGFVPGIPRITLNPDLIFLGVLPPLLYSAAWLTSWRDFKFHIASISLLAFGLVGFTVAGVAWTASLLFPGFDARTGVVLGAVVATTDAIAATTIARRVGLPQRIVDILEGESLVNDATGLLALEFGLAMVVDGAVPTIWEGVGRLLWLVIAGVGVGLALGLLVDRVERLVDDGPIEISISVMIPYAAYLGAEAIHASGVLAVVACGLYLSRQSAHFFSAGVRLQVWAVWDALTFVLNGIVFVLIGLQLPYVRAGIQAYSLGTLALYGLFFSALVIALRLIWTFPGAHLAAFIRQHLQGQQVQKLDVRQIFVVGWTGMRGVVALAAALSLPATLGDGSPFAQRNLIVFLTFSVILVTLVLQGLTLPPLIRSLRLAGLEGPNCEEQEARHIVLQAAMTHLSEARSHDRPEFRPLYDDLAQHYRERMATLLGRDGDGDGTSLENSARYQELMQEVLRVERQTAVGLRNEGRINDEVLRRIERELDLSETRFHVD